MKDKQKDKIWVFTDKTASETQQIQDFIGREKKAKKNSIFHKIKSFFNF